MPIDTSLDFVPINIAIITISDTRTIKDDTSGDILEGRINESGHKMIERNIIPDDVDKITETLETMSSQKEIDCIMYPGWVWNKARESGECSIFSKNAYYRPTLKQLS